VEASWYIVGIPKVVETLLLVGVGLLIRLVGNSSDEWKVGHSSDGAVIRVLVSQI
jgi:hypothetical protein